MTSYWHEDWTTDFLGDAPSLLNLPFLPLSLKWFTPSLKTLARCRYCTQLSTSTINFIHTSSLISFTSYMQRNPNVLKTFVCSVFAWLRPKRLRSPWVSRYESADFFCWVTTSYSRGHIVNSTAAILALEKMWTANTFGKVNEDVTLTVTLEIF